MRSLFRFRLRTLLIGVSVLAIALGSTMAHYRWQSQAMAKFMQRDIYIYPHYVGPEALRGCLQGTGLLVRPFCAQVLLEPAGPLHVRFAGRAHRLGSLGEDLKALQRELHSTFGLATFVLVMSHEGGPCPAEAFREIDEVQLGDGLRVLVTPCGYSNFRPSRQVFK